MKFLKITSFFFVVTASFAQQPIHQHAHEHSTTVQSSVHSHIPPTGPRIVTIPRQPDRSRVHGHHQGSLNASGTARHHHAGTAQARNSNRLPLNTRETQHKHQG
ncbi:MAG: hypothetical protein CK426_01705 [Legionella sp.]|nr:MAG: hypothetical protein CK423_00035 [Legionella sp.]PJD99524.1 MAG: hypothetical protein CK426_01705 [Legionella sp.]